MENRSFEGAKCLKALELDFIVVQLAIKSQMGVERGAGYSSIARESLDSS